MARGGASVLVTGGAGYIGSHVVLALLDAGYRVVVVDDLSTGLRGAVDSRAAFFDSGIKNESLVRDIIRGYDVRAVMHVAGTVDVSEPIWDPMVYYRNNTAASRTLIDLAVSCGVAHFMFSSSAAVYGSATQSPISENAAILPDSPFGRSKLMTEVMLADAAAAHALNYCALRYFNVAGADPQGRAGQSTRGATQLIKVASEAVLGKRRHVEIFGRDFDTPDGTGVRDYIHVSDVASAHVAALEALVAAPGRNLVLNCGNGRGHSVLEVLDTVERVTKVRIERRFVARRPGDPAVTVADCRAIRDLLGWQPKYDSLEHIVRDAYRWEMRTPTAPPGGPFMLSAVQPTAARRSMPAMPQVESVRSQPISGPSPIDTVRLPSQ